MYRYMGYTDRQKIQTMCEAGRTAKEVAEIFGYAAGDCLQRIQAWEAQALRTDAVVQIDAKVVPKLSMYETVGVGKSRAFQP